MVRAQFTAAETEYCFVDNAYLRRQFIDTMTAIFGDAELEARPLPFSARRTFIYDCIDVKREGEDQADYEARIQQQESYLNGLRSIPGYHVKLGTLTTGRRPAQKQVDVQLAVDMLMHSHNGNMDKAILITGDLDFKPVVEALVLMGVYVTIVAKPATISKELKHAADACWSLEPTHLYELASDQFKKRYPKPAAIYCYPRHVVFSRVDSQAQIGDHEVTIGVPANSQLQHQIVISNHGPNPGQVLQVQADDFEVAKRWISTSFQIDLTA